MRTKVLKPMALIMMFVLSFSFLEATFLPVNVQAYGDDNPIIVVSMGDSYSAGEGIEPFYGQTNPDGSDVPRALKIHSADWIAHRSTKSWPSLLKVGDFNVRDYKKNINGLDAPGLIGSSDSSACEWYFVAATGAVTDNFDNPYERGIKKNKDGKDENIVKTYIGGSPMKPESYKVESDSASKLDPQLQVFEDNNLKGRVDYVTMTIGGNDLGFTEIVIDSVKSTFFNPNSLKNLIAQKRKLWFTEIKEKLKQSYKKVYEAAGPQAEIIVVGYPELYYRDKNTWAAGREQRKIIDNFVVEFCDQNNGRIVEAINECNLEFAYGKIHYVSVIEKFRENGGHGADAPEEWINGITLTGTQVLDESDISERVYPSMHPNKEGAEAYAELVNKKIEELEKIKSNSSVSGYVYNNINGTQEYDGDTWIGIPGVTITVKEDVSGEGLHSLDDKTTITDSNGHYDIKLPAGKYEIEASHPTYGTQSISNVIVYDNKITEAEWIVFNGKFSSTTLRIPGEDPIHTYNSNAEWAWTAYDHPNYDTSSGYDKHIIIDGDNIKMDGYLQAGYKDFLYVDDKNSTRRVFELDFQRDQTSRYDSEYNWHSMYGGGFLFNTSINEEENTISGYYILITESGAELFKIDNMAFDTFRNSENRGERLSTFTFDNRFDKHHIKIDVSSNSVSLYDGEALVIDNYKLVENYGNGFGPITSHIRHDCEQRSYFTFSNITMQTM